jgi:hypothetical protein
MGSGTKKVKQSFRSLVVDDEDDDGVFFFFSQNITSSKTQN